MSDVASTFVSRPLDDVFWFQEGPGVRKWQFFTEGIKLLNVANIEKQGRLNLAKTDRHLSVDEATGKYSHFLLDEGDLVIASSGISFDEDGLLRTRGAFVEREHLPLCLNTSTIRFKPKEGQSDLNFLRHWLNGLEFRTQITKLVTGSAQQNFGPTHLKALNISIPPIEEQRRIAAILDQAETLRTQRRQALAHLDTLTQSLFLDMFGDPVANPKGWTTQSLQKVCDPINDCPHSTPEWTDSGEICLRTSNLTIGGWNWADTRYVAETTFHERSKRGYLATGDIVLSREGTVGIAAIVQDGMKLCMGQRLVQVRPLPSVLEPEYLLRHLLYVLSPSRISQLMVGSTSQHLNVKELRALRIPIPTLSLQQTFATRIQAIEALKATHRTALAQLDALFASLQQRAFAGEL